MLSAAEIAAMQAEAARTDTHTAVIHRDQETTNAGGSTRRGYAPVASGPGSAATPLPCRLRATQGRPQQADEGAKAVSITVWEVLCAAGADIRPGDRLYIDTVPPAGALRYDVEDADRGRAHAVRQVVPVRKVTPA
jgi:hypothetical protein